MQICGTESLSDDNNLRYEPQILGNLHGLQFLLDFFSPKYTEVLLVIDGPFGNGGHGPYVYRWLCGPWG